MMGVVSDDSHNQNSLVEARRLARPLIRYWLRKVESAVLSGRLRPIDLMLAKELTNYPSANEGRCYAGQKRLGAAIARSDRTARECLKRLSQDGLLVSKRGGPGRTASWTFCFKNTPIFGSDIAAQDRKTVAGLDRKPASDKPSEPDPDIERKPPPTPTNDGALGATVGLPMKEDQVGRAIDGEIIIGEISFSEFWMATGRHGPEGYARAEWRKLTLADKAAIADRMRTHGELSLRGLWAGGWLRDRVWDEPDEPDEGGNGAGCIAEFDFEQFMPAQRRRVVWSLDQPEFKAEYERRLQAGEDVAVMEGAMRRGGRCTLDLSISAKSSV